MGFIPGAFNSAQALKVQVYSSSTDLILLGSSDVFDEPVSASLAIYGGQIEG